MFSPEAGMGLPELLVTIPLALAAMAVPIATLVGVFLIYGKVKHIEQSLSSDSAE